MAVQNLAHTGCAIPTYLTSNIAASGTTTFTVASTTGWLDAVTGSAITGPFVVAVDYGTSNEEKILVTMSSNTLTIVSRGVDFTNVGNTISHNSGTGCIVVPVITAGELTTANTAAVAATYMGIGTAAQPLAVGTSIATGSSAFAAPMDHVHTLPTSVLNASLPSVLPTGTSVSKVFNNTGSNTLSGITGYNNYMIVATAEYALATASGSLTQTLTVNGATGNGSAINYMTPSGSGGYFSLTSAYAYAAPSAATSFSVVIAFAGPTGAAQSAQNIHVIGFN